MSTKRKNIIPCLAVAVAGQAALAAAPPVDQEWQCSPGATGTWNCAAVARPAGPFANVPRPFRAATRAAPPGAPAADALTETMDWVPRAQLSATDQAALPAACGGRYVEPPLDLPTGETAVFGTVYASSNESELQRDPDVARFSGDVTVSQGDRRLRADSATYLREESRVEIAGQVQYREPGLLLRGDKASFSTEKGTAELEKGRFVMHAQQLRGDADSIRRNENGTIDLDGASYTQCEPGADDWKIEAEHIHLDRETGQGTAKNARLEVRGVPVLYTPYIRFPVDDRRMSGFLWPSFANASQNGLDVALPYYLNIAPNYDATITPRYMDQRGPMASLELRTLNRFGHFAATGSYLPDDNVEHDERWLTGLQHQGNPYAHVSTFIDYTKVSDEDYLRNLGASGLDVKRSTHLLQNGGVDWQIDRNWHAQALVEQYQLLDLSLVTPYKIMPRLELARDAGGEPFRIDYALRSQYTAFQHENSNRLTGQRLYVEPQLSYPMEWAAGYIKPTAGFQSISYNLEDGYCQTAQPGGNCRPGSDSPSVAAASFSLDGGYFLERESALFGGSFLQTLEPRAYYLYVGSDGHRDIPNFDTSELTFSFEQLFRNTRFSGHDRIADANQGSLSVTSRLIDDASGREVLTASIGQIYYFDERRVTLGNLPRMQESESSSEIAAELQARPSREIWVSGTTLWDTGRDRIDEGGVQMHWSPAEDTLFNLGYRYRRDHTEVAIDGNGDPILDFAGNPLIIERPIDQVDFSTTLPLGQHWKLFARYQYDLTNDASLEELAGIEYSSCCWSVRMVYQEGVDWDNGRDYGFYLQFMLRGLGGIGKDIDRMLEKSIFGYGTNEEEYGFVY